jgi:hypothetical protein
MILLAEFISHCECHLSNADIFLRAQFVRGIHDNSIREHIFQSEILAFDEIAKNVVTLGASKTGRRELSKKSATLMSANEEVNKVFKYKNT